MNRRYISFLAIACAAGSLTAALPAASDAREKRRAVDMTWTAVKAHVDDEDGNWVDAFKTSGPPFGSLKLHTFTPLDERDEDIKHTDFAIHAFKHLGHLEEVTGHLRIKQKYVETTNAYQTRSYTGTGSFEPRKETYPFQYSGLIKTFKGQVTCYFATGRCSGSIHVTGSIKY